MFDGTRRLNKPGQPVKPDQPVEVRGRDHPWVSRGGIKLAHALDCFAIDPAGKICLDIGASTGGFSDVLLSRGAARVYAVDVGLGQLAWKLRQDPRVVVLEKTNARNLDQTLIPEPVEMIVADVSFISLTLALPAALPLAAAGAWLVSLIKPQFEAGRDRVGKGGVVRDQAVREDACRRIGGWLGAQAGWRVIGLIESPIRGPKGNVEYLIGARRDADTPVTDQLHRAAPSDASGDRPIPAPS